MTSHLTSRGRQWPHWVRADRLNPPIYSVGFNSSYDLICQSNSQKNICSMHDNAEALKFEVMQHLNITSIPSLSLSLSLSLLYHFPRPNSSKVRNLNPVPFCGNRTFKHSGIHSSCLFLSKESETARVLGILYIHRRLLLLNC